MAENEAAVNFENIIAAVIDPTSKNFTGYFNNQPLHGPPISLNHLTTALLRYVTNDPQFKVTVTNEPMPYNIQVGIKWTHFLA